jgi:phage/plasmid-like protein (TIGR03299 family)
MSNAIAAPSARPETAREAVQAYGLDWQVGLAPVQALVDPPRPVARARAVVRLDTNEPLSVVGRRYQPIQNAEAFGLFDSVLAKFGATYMGAGACDGGRRVWIQAKLPGGMWITKEDEVEKYLLLSMLHGGGCLQVLDTPIRVWCRNTLLRALEEGRRRAIRICHRGDIAREIEAAERLLELSLGSFEAFESQAQTFAARMIRKEALDAYFRTLIPNPKEGDPARAAATRGHLVRLFETGKGNALPSVRGTLWAALNGVVEWIDHERPTRVADGVDPSSTRWKSAQFGTGAALKARVWSEALALLR